MSVQVTFDVYLFTLFSVQYGELFVFGKYVVIDTG